MKKFLAVLALISTVVFGASLNVPLPDGCTPVISGNTVTCSPVPPPVQPPPVVQAPVGTQLVWNPIGNAPRVFVTNVKAGDVRTFWFRTPATLPTRNHVTMSAAYSAFEDSFKTWLLKDAAGAVLSSKTGQGAMFQFQVGVPVVKWTFGVNPAIELKPDSVYTFTVIVSACSNRCDYYIDVNAT